jgi:hypothetical protein
MKIHGTAKGGAISKKDFGVAFGGAAAVPAIAPDEISDLYAWYDATDVTTITKDGSNRVSKWENKEGTSARDLVATTLDGVTTAPLWLSADRNGKDVIDFATVGADEYRYMLTSSVQADVNQPISFVVVTEMAVNDSTERDFMQGFEFGSFFPVFHKDAAANSFHMSMGTPLTFIESGIAGTWQYLTIICNTTSSEIRVGGVQKASGTVGTSAAFPLRVGVSWNNDAPWNKKIMHIVFYSKLLSESEIAGLESWAAEQGGL